MGVKDDRTYTDGQFYTVIEPYYSGFRPRPDSDLDGEVCGLRYCCLCCQYKPLSEMGEVACRECEDG